MTQLTVKDIALRDVGRTILATVYPSKNKTAKPRRRGTRLSDGSVLWTVEPVKVHLDSIYVHENGNILVGQTYYLRANDPITFID